MLKRIRAVFDTGLGTHGFTECRQCGSRLDTGATNCEQCGSGEVAHYDL